MPITEGNFPLALPGGMGQVSRKPRSLKTPLIAATPARAAIAFPDSEYKKKGGAFHKKGAQAFPQGF